MRKEMASEALADRIPMVGNGQLFASGGFLLGYGAAFRDLVQGRCQIHQENSCRGTSQQYPSRAGHEFEAGVNLRTAKALGIQLPTTILLRANEVIE